MKRWLMMSVVGVFAAPALAAAQAGNAGSVTIEALNPRSDLEPPPIVAPVARVKELAGKRVGIYWLGKYGGDNFFDAFEQVLKEKYPTVMTVRYRGPLQIPESMASKVAKEVDTLVYGVGD